MWFCSLFCLSTVSYQYGISRMQFRNAKAKGIRIGRPETTVDNIPSQFFKLYNRYQNKLLTITEMARIMQCSRATIYKYIGIVESSSG